MNAVVRETITEVLAGSLWKGRSIFSKLSD